MNNKLNRNRLYSIVGCPNLLLFLIIYLAITFLVVYLLRAISILPANITFFLAIIIYTTLVSMRIRNALYESLLEKINKKDLSSFFGKVKKEFGKASHSLDMVNTLAILEKYYLKEEFKFFELDLSCEKWSYFSKILPNLLISLGLLGTFLGITNNLSGISEILNNTSDDAILIQNLQTPLQSMGVAFFSSLIALLCSLALTIVNFIWNTDIAKNKLMNHIENQLDNIDLINAQGDTRISKEIRQMTKKQEEFLTRFHENISKVLGETLGKVANRIEEENIKSSQNLNYLATEFMKSSGRLQDASTSLDDFANKIQTAIQHDNFIVYAETFENSVNKFKQFADSIESSKFPETLKKLTQLLVEMQELCVEVKKLNRYSAGLLTSNQSKISTEIEFFEKILNQFPNIFNLLQENQIALHQSLTQIELGIVSSLNENNEASLSTFVEFRDKLNLAIVSVSSQISFLQNFVKEAIAEQSNDIKFTADKALLKIYQYNQSMFDLLQEIQDLRIKGNEQLESTNTLSIEIIEALKLNNQNISSSIQQSQNIFDNLNASNQNNSVELKDLISKQLTSTLNSTNDLLANILANDQEIKQTIEEAYNQISNGNKHSANSIELTIGKLEQILKNMSQITNFIEIQSLESNKNTIIDRLREL